MGVVVPSVVVTVVVVVPAVVTSFVVIDDSLLFSASRRSSASISVSFSSLDWSSLGEVGSAMLEFSETWFVLRLDLGLSVKKGCRGFT